MPVRLSCLAGSLSPALLRFTDDALHLVPEPPWAVHQGAIPRTQWQQALARVFTLLASGVKPKLPVAWLL